MQDQLIQIRQQLASTIKIVDVLLSTAAPSSLEIDTMEYRASPGGMLSDKGVVEMYRRFEDGEPDAVIARAMAVSVQGVQKRRTIWKNERNGITAGMGKTHPTYLKLEAIIKSPEGRRAAIEATAQGLPALAGIEPMIVAQLAGAYGPHDQGTATAGSIIAEVMREAGYEVDTNSAPMPKGSVAKTAAFWKPAEL